MTSEAPMKALKTIRKDATVNERLELFKTTLRTSDIIIANHMKLGVSSVTSHMPSGSNRPISVDWLNKFCNTFPFVDKTYMLDGKGEMFQKWSKKQIHDFVHSSDYYGEKVKDAEAKGALEKVDKYRGKYKFISKDLIDEAIREGKFLEILIDMFEKKFGAGKLTNEVNKVVCKRIREIRETQEGIPKENSRGEKESTKCTQQDFARMLNVTRSMITSIELARQSPNTHFIQRLGSDFSDQPGMGLKTKDGKSVRINYDWLLEDSKLGEEQNNMFKSHGIEDDDKVKLKAEIEELRAVIEAQAAKIEKLEAQVDLKDKITAELLKAQPKNEENSKGFSH